ncbi:polysaccharide biosynthesis protein [Actinotalea fermentans]|uniref:Polysaccharide biosynthesis protein n=1 Tax=Actinotalea fermentans TaxID=43671 RepID=A0A511YTS4_9CELL|nr:hypothetical protein [Actinotalea fermentans]GEN78591.1 polysaccharide biosynthesis protein [Actinotalea fermentans]
MPERRVSNLRDLLVVAGGTTLANAAAYGLSIASARILAPAEFGALGALLGVSIIVSTFAIGCQTLAARRVAAGVALGRTDVVMRAGAWAAGALLILAAPSMAAAPVLGVPSAAMLAVVASVAVSVLGFTAIGVLQGRRLHTRFGGTYAALGILRATGTVVAVAVEPTATSAGLGMLVGSAAGSAVALAVARERVPLGLPGPNVLRELWRNSASLLGLYLLVNMDVVLARTFLEPADSGAYAVGSLVAKVAFFLPGFISYVLFPRMAAASTPRLRTANVLATVAVGAGATAACAVLAPWVVQVAAGPGYEAIVPLIWVFALQGSLFATLQALLFLRLSDPGSGADWRLWVGAAGVVGVVAVVHGSIAAIVLSGVSVSVALTLWVSVVELRRTPTPTRPCVDDEGRRAVAPGDGALS